MGKQKHVKVVHQTHIITQHHNNANHAQLDINLLMLYINVLENNALGISSGVQLNKNVYRAPSDMFIVQLIKNVFIQFLLNRLHAMVDNYMILIIKDVYVQLINLTGMEISVLFVIKEPSGILILSIVFLVLMDTIIMQLKANV